MTIILFYPGREETGGILKNTGGISKYNLYSVFSHTNIFSKNVPKLRDGDSHFVWQELLKFYGIPIRVVKKHLISSAYTPEIGYIRG